MALGVGAGVAVWAARSIGYVRVRSLLSFASAITHGSRRGFTMVMVSVRDSPAGGKEEEGRDGGREGIPVRALWGKGWGGRRGGAGAKKQAR